MHIVHIMTIPFKGEDLTTPARSVECFDAAINCADVAERKGGCYEHGEKSCKKVIPSQANLTHKLNLLRFFLKVCKPKFSKLLVTINLQVTSEVAVSLLQISSKFLASL